MGFKTAVINNMRVPIVPNLSERILQYVEQDPSLLRMDMYHAREWEGKAHSCKTPHCIAGWAVTLAGKLGVQLESKYHTEDVAERLFRASEPEKEPPRFDGDIPDRVALHNLKRRVKSLKRIRRVKSARKNV